MMILNQNTDVIPHDAIYVGRPSKWGNIFHIGRDGTRSEVVQKYEEYVRSSPELLAALPELIGHNLVCSCSPKLCHASVLIQLLIEIDREKLIER